MNRVCEGENLSLSPMIDEAHHQKPGQNNDSSPPWHKHVEEEASVEAESPGAWSKDAGGLQRKEMFFRVELKSSMTQHHSTVLLIIFTS